MAIIAPEPVQREAEVFARRLAIHLAKREYAEARLLFDRAIEQVDNVWSQLGRPPIHVSDLDLPQEIYCALADHDIYTIAQLLRWKANDLIIHKVLGVGRVAILQSHLSQHGLKLRGTKSR